MTWLLVLTVLVIVWLYLICPRLDRGNTLRMQGQNVLYVAHRGLHDAQIPENSLAAFRKAVDAGYAIELDVRLTKDKALAVLHDETTERMCGTKCVVSDKTMAELSCCRLSDSPYTIPSLNQVLEVVRGRVPLIIEMKSTGTNPETARVLLEALRGYRGQYAVESFNPFLLWYVKKHAPQITRGQLTGARAKERRDISYCLLCLIDRLLFVNALSRPDFIAYDEQDVGKTLFTLERKLFHPICAVWTIRNADQANKASTQCDMMIFEGFDPRNDLKGVNDHG